MELVGHTEPEHNVVYNPYCLSLFAFVVIHFFFAPSILVGFAGEPGIDGIQGLQGPPGPKGIKGDDGGFTGIGLTGKDSKIVTFILSIYFFKYLNHWMAHIQAWGSSSFYLKYELMITQTIRGIVCTSLLSSMF